MITKWFQNLSCSLYYEKWSHAYIPLKIHLALNICESIWSQKDILKFTLKLSYLVLAMLNNKECKQITM